MAGNADFRMHDSGQLMPVCLEGNAVAALCVRRPLAIVTPLRPPFDHGKLPTLTTCY